MKFNGYEFNENFLYCVVSKVKQNPSYRDLDYDFIVNIINILIRKNQKFFSLLKKSSIIFSNFSDEQKCARVSKSSSFKQVIKEIRSKIRKSHIVYENNINKRENLLKLLNELFLNTKGQYKQNKSQCKPNEDKRDITLDTTVFNDIVVELLKTHKSSDERLPFYDSIYKFIFNECNNVQSIVDIGCGLNPISTFLYPNYFAGKRYLALDINKSEINIINRVSEIWNILLESSNVHTIDSKNPVKSKKIKPNKINLRAIVYNATDALELISSKKTSTKNLDKIPQEFREDIIKGFDLVFLFKVIDIFETKGHKLAEKFIRGINAKCIIVSFSTKTVSEREMNFPKRGWIERMLDRLGYKWSFFSVRNESFYVIMKSDGNH